MPLSTARTSSSNPVPSSHCAGHDSNERAIWPQGMRGLSTSQEGKRKLWSGTRPEARRDAT
eukprot:540789-Rhodomonas_salina.2